MIPGDTSENCPLHPFQGHGSSFSTLFSHMLIRGLALDCGYSSSSIRERIYSAVDPDPMAGILLYTATPDSDGSLGGLAEKGTPSHLEPLLRDALDRGLFCSSDPLCGHTGVTGHLNGAACHACLLLSETSCERSNRYLDRGGGDPNRRPARHQLLPVIDEKILGAIAKLALDEGAEKLEAFADALERGEIDARASAGALQACLGLPHARLRRYRDLLNEASDISELLVALRSAAATVAAVGDMQTDVELAWTYPGSARLRAKNHRWRRQRDRRF